MDATSSSSWPRWRCPEPCSPRSCVGSIGSDPSRSRHELVAAMRGSRQRRCVHDQRRPAHTRPKRRSQSAKDGSARAWRCFRCSGLPAALEGRKLDRQRPASGKCRFTLRPVPIHKRKSIEIVCKKSQFCAGKARRLRVDFGVKPLMPKHNPPPPEPTMRQERTVQASIFDLFAGHEIGRELEGDVGVAG